MQNCGISIMNYCGNAIGILHRIYDIKEATGEALGACVCLKLRIGYKYYVIISEGVVDCPEALKLGWKLMH